MKRLETEWRRSSRGILLTIITSSAPHTHVYISNICEQDQCIPKGSNVQDPALGILCLRLSIYIDQLKYSCSFLREESCRLLHLGLHQPCLWCTRPCISYIYQLKYTSLNTAVVSLERGIVRRSTWVCTSIAHCLQGCALRILQLYLG
jgi:hypothetical protein